MAKITTWYVSEPPADIHPTLNGFKPPDRVVLEMAAGRWERKQANPLYIVLLLKTEDAKITVKDDGAADHQVMEWIPGSLITVEKGCQVCVESGRIFFIASVIPPPIADWILVPLK
jgi:hypothetical protein